MTNWTDITSGEIDTDSPVTQPLMTALRDNPVAMGEGRSGAPMARSSWHPYNNLEYFDGNDGNIYDYAVDGASSSVETPAFADGFEYCLIGLGLSHGGGSAADILIDLYKETTPAWVNAITYDLNTLSKVASFEAVILMPRSSQNYHFVSCNFGESAIAGSALGGQCHHATAQTVSKARIRLNAYSFDQGKIYLYRRRIDQ